jgi:hypothetical protein
MNINSEEYPLINRILADSSSEASKHSEFWNDISIPTSTSTQIITQQENRSSILNRWSFDVQTRSQDDLYVNLSENFFDRDYQTQSEWIDGNTLEWSTENRASDRYSEPLTQEAGSTRNGDGWSERYSDSGSDNTLQDCEAPASDPVLANFWVRVKDRTSYDGSAFSGTNWVYSRWGSSSD